ncbi:MAG TPA: C2 family cysteine protease [Phycisphaerae bacterium]|nr:C2 family cysteine protease [Phycisphaerae bacterium]
MAYSCSPPSTASRSQSQRHTVLQLEALETRINLSTLSSLAIPPVTVNTPIRTVGTLAGGNAAVSLTAGGSSTSISPSAGTPVAIDSYSGISNCQVVYANGQPIVGATTGGNAYVEYTVTAPTAGAYVVNLTLAAPNGAGVRVLANGNAAPSDIWTAATDSWSRNVSGKVTIQLAAGANVIRLASLYDTRYTISSLTLSPVALTVTPPPASSTSSVTATAVGSDSWLSLGSYTDDWNFSLTQGQWGPAMVATSTTGSYIDYTINVATAGAYTLRSGLASTTGGTVSVSSGGNALGSFVIGSTGAADSFTLFSQTINLAAGTQTIRLSANAGTLVNLNSLELARQTPSSTTTTTTSSSSTSTSSTSTTSTTTTPPPANTPSAPAAGAITVSQRWMSSFTELDIAGTSGNDNILLSQDGSTLTISAGGQTQTVTGNFGDIVIHGGAGNDTLSVASSVTASTLVYGDAGNNTIVDLGQGKAMLVTLGAGNDTLTGNGINTSYWVDPADKVNASAAEWNAGDVHSVASFYQPTGAAPGSAGYITTALNGQAIQDPTVNSGDSFTRLTTSSLWGSGPAMTDINQGGVSDCYFLTTLQDLARLQPGTLENMAVDLGDGTYAVQFVRNGTPIYVRVDGDLAMNQWGTLDYNHLGPSGDQWASIMEKAYAYFRTGANSYSSLNMGWMTNVYSDLGVASVNFSMTDQNSFYTFVTQTLAAGKGVDFGTQPTINGGAPLVSSHTYSILGVSYDSTGTVQVSLRNPWGIDGFTVDANPYDGLLTISFATLKANALSGVAMT